MKKFRILTCAVLVGIMTLASSVCALAEEKIKLYEDDIEVVTQNDPVIINDRVFVPLRDAFDAVGATNITWNASEQSITAEKEKVIVVMKIGEEKYTVKTPDGTVEYQMDAAPVIIDSYTYVPARYAAEAFGYSIEWDAEKRIVRLLGDFSHNGYDETTPYYISQTESGWIENGFCSFSICFTNKNGEAVTPDGYLFVEVYNSDNIQMYHNVARFEARNYNDDEYKSLQYNIFLTELPPTEKSDGYITIHVQTDAGIIFDTNMPVEGLPTKW